MSQPNTAAARDAGGAPSTAPADARIDPNIGDMRRHVARGTILNSGYQVGFAALGLVQRLVTAAFLTRAEFGLWAIILTILVTLAWLRQVGIMDKYVQQSEPDQEAAFQKAFSLELLTSLAFCGLVVIALPLYAIAYGHPEIIAAGLVCAVAVPLTAFESPAWIPYRRLQYARQRLLMSIDPVLTFVVTVGLAAAGVGYWCFVIGIVAGSLAGAIVCTVTSPYRLRLRLDRNTVREYASFSWPLVGSGLSMLLVVQGSLLVINWTVGLAAVGAIALATGVAVFADRVDTIVSQTIYPAVCAVADKPRLLFETFVKSNRLALMWALPFGVGLALFAADFVRFVLGSRWEPAVGLLIAFGLTCAFGQVAFNWTVFMRAVNRTRPIFVGAALNFAVFVLVSLPAMFAFGLAGYAAGFAAATFVQVIVRGYYMRRLFAGFKILRQLARAVVPVVPGTAAVLVLRVATGSRPDLPLAIAELAVYVLLTIGCTMLLERKLVLEILGYVVGRRGHPTMRAAASAVPQPPTAT